MDGRLQELERRVRSDPGDAAGRLRLASAYRRFGRPCMAYRELLAIDEPPSPELRHQVALRQRALLAHLEGGGARVALRRGAWGWSWQDLRDWLRDPAEPLQALDLAWSGSASRALAHPDAFVSLTWLGLAGTDLARSDLVGLERLPRLRHLDLSYVKLGSDGLEPLARLAGLESVVLANCDGVTSEAAAHLTPLSGIRRVHLDWTRSGDDALASLAALPLTHLSLLGCRISDVGLLHLRRVGSLMSLDLSFCQEVTAHGVGLLRSAIPGLYVGR